MPNVVFTNWNRTVRAGPLGNVRTIAKLAGINLYNGLAKALNCHGAGTCGTCRVVIADPASVTPPTLREKLHGCTGPYRLACQTRVADDRHEVLVTKHEGFLGKGRVPVTVENAVPAAAPKA